MLTPNIGPGLKGRWGPEKILPDNSHPSIRDQALSVLHGNRQYPVADALGLSGIPVDGPIGAVRVGLVDGKFVANPTNDQQAVSSLELIIAGTEEAILMVESGAKEVPEETILEAIAFGHAECRRLAKLQKDLVAKAGKPRWPFDPSAGRDRDVEARVRSLAGPKLATALATHDKQARAEAVGR